MAINLYVLIYTAVTFGMGKYLQIHNVRDDGKTLNYNLKTCNVMFENRIIDEWMWFFKRISCFTLWQVPMIMIFWKKSSKIKKINKKKR